MSVPLDLIYVKLYGKGHRSKFEVTGRKCCQRGRCDLNWGLF